MMQLVVLIAIFLISELVCRVPRVSRPRIPPRLEPHNRTFAAVAVTVAIGQQAGFLQPSFLAEILPTVREQVHKLCLEIFIL